MEAGRELDALVAESVMGWVWKHGEHWDITSVPGDKQLHLLEPSTNIVDMIPGEFTSISDWPPQDGRIIWSHLPHYSTDIAAAWQVVEKIKKDFEWVKVLTTVDGTIVRIVKGDKEYVGMDDTAPLAICLAALAAVGVEV